MACRWRSLRLCLFTVRFLEARSTSFRRLLVDTRPSTVFVVSLWCSSRSPRLCGLSVIGAWPSRAWGGFRFGSRVRAANLVFSPWFGGSGCSEALGAPGLRGLFSGAGACATGGGFPGRDFPPLSFSCFVIVCVCLDSLLCTYINLVIGSCPECVTDSLFQ
jgi:hypothetical protein